MKNVLVFFGGKSCEHDVSIITGVMTLNGVNKKTYNVIPVFVSKSGEWYTGDKLCDLSFYGKINYKDLKKCVLLPSDDRLYVLKANKIKPVCQIYSAINCMHGGYGEGGEFTAIIKNSKIPFVCSDLFASSLAMDKEFTKIALKAIGVESLPFIKLLRDAYYIKRDYAVKIIRKKLGFPVVIKPAKLGSSIGISVAKNDRELEKGIDFAFKFDEKIIVEKGLENFREINCAVYKGDGQTRVSPLEEVEKTEDILSFTDKYEIPAKKVFPAKIDGEIGTRIKSISGAIYRKLAFSGVVRIDFLIEGNTVYVNEINSIPGSMAYYLFCKDFNEYSTMLSKLIEESIDYFKSSALSINTFDGDILNLSSTKIRK